MSKSLISIFTFIKGLYNSILAPIPAPISRGCLVREKRPWGSESTGAGMSTGPRGLVYPRRWGPGGFLAFICHRHLRNSTVVFAADWLASCLLYICHADFTPSKIRSSCHWSVSLVGKGKKKIMPNHLEDIKCQQAEEGKKKSFAIFNGSFIALNVCCCCSFFL